MPKLDALLQILNGKADEKRVRPADVNPKELAIGEAVEREHSSNPAVQQRISLDHLAEDPEYYTKPEHLDFEAEAKKEAAMRVAHYLVGMKRAFDMNGLKFGAAGWDWGDGSRTRSRNLYKMYATFKNSLGNITSNMRRVTGADGATTNAGTQFVANNWKGSPIGKPQPPTKPQSKAVAAPETPAATQLASMPQQSMTVDHNPSANNPAEPFKTLTASWNKFAQELAGGGSSSGGTAPLYNSVDQKPVTLATPEPMSRPEKQKGNSLYDMFATRFPQAHIVGQNENAVDVDEDKSVSPGYAARQPEGKTYVMDTPMAPQVGA